MEVREARPDEHRLAGAITAEAYRGLVRDESYLARIADVSERASRTVILVAVDAEAIVGSLTLELGRRVNPEDDPLETHRAHIRMLGVAPAAQRRGIGRALMVEAESRARTAGKTEITLHTTEWMAGAQRLYGSMGYERTPDEVFPDGFVLLGYRKVLDAGSV